MENTFVVLKETKSDLFDLFNDDFMQAYTNFRSFEEFVFSGAVFVNWQAPEIMGSRAAFDFCVQGKSIFSSWEEMYEKALEAQQNGGLRK